MTLALNTHRAATESEDVMFTKITDDDRVGKGVTGLADTPELETTDMQMKFDELGNMGIDGINRLIDELASEDADKGTGASNIGVQVPEGIVATANVQAVLNALAILVEANDGARHTHENKATLDAITAMVKSGYDRLVTLLTGITTLDAASLTNSAAAIPTSAAVLASLGTYTYDNLKRAIFPVGSVVLNTTGVNPSQYIGGTWTEIYDLFSATSGVYAYRRTS